MEISVARQPFYMDSFWWFLGCGIVFVVGSVLFAITILKIIVLLTNKDKKNANGFRFLKGINKEAIRQQTLQQLGLIEKNLREGKISARDGAVAISKTVRDFIFAVTGYEITKKSLMEIRSWQQPQVTQLISHLYGPEFSKPSIKDDTMLLDEARKLVMTWY